MSTGQGKRQVAQSNSKIDETIRNTKRQIQEIRLKNEKLQKDSRLYDDKRSKQRYNSIQEQAIQSNKKNTALQMKWSELKEEEECQKLFNAISEQKAIFKNIIDGKDRLIEQFTEELKKKDDDYFKMLKEQSQDIKELVVRMRDQFFTLRDKNLQELEEIQRKFELERKDYIKTSMDTVDKCFQNHINAQEQFAMKKIKAEDDFTKRIEDLRVDGAKNYASTKIRLETEIQELEKYYEEMKALYQLNTEKLDYNLKVLKEKKDQNSRLETEMTRKQRLLNNRLRALKEQYDKSEKNFKEQNKTLTQQYKRITRQFKDLQRKFKHFQKADLDRYNEIQAMNESQVQSLKDKILKCNLTIHNQQLGMPWLPQQQKEEDERPAVNRLASTLPEGQSGEETRIVIGEKKLTQMVGILLDQADFMFDDKMREELERASLQIKLNEKIDLLKKTLNIDSIEEFNMFLEEMANKCKWVSEREKQARIEERLRREQQQREEEERMNRRGRRRVQERKQEEKKEEPQPQVEPPVDLSTDFKVDPTLVVDFLIHWMSTKEQRKKMLQKIIKKSIDQLSQRQKKEHIAREGKKYWQKLTQVLPQRTFRIWKVLDKALTKYYELLLARQKLIDETSQLHTQNEQLKKLLNQYLQINHELLIPPTRLMEKDN